MVKICGITDVKTALIVDSLGADAIGFVFAKSKRQISPDLAGEISSQLSPRIEKVGVFVNETKEQIDKIIKLAKLTMVQLHGEESPEFCQSLSVPVIKAFSIGSKEDLLQISKYSCEFILLDSPKGNYHGGNGVSFNWDILVNLNLSHKKVILAGGLQENNIVEAINKVKPYMVDVSSGVETNGKKDLHKIKNFIEKTKKCSLLEGRGKSR